MRNSIKELLQELDDNHGMLSIKSYSQYRKNGVIVGLERANTGFTFDRTLILSDGSKITAWM